jgi:hypothetical protein
MAMKTISVKLATALAALLCIGFASLPALADDNGAAPGVARVSLINGDVTLQHGDNGDTEAAVVNAPVSVGDYLSTGGGSRAEVQLDNVDFLRVGENAQMRFAKLDPNDHQIQLAAGTAELRVLGSSSANVQMDTPSITIRPDEPGAYRVTVDGNGNTTLTVRSGQADLLGPQGAQTIDAGTSVQVTGSASDPQVSQIDTLAYDDFDSWNSQRDQYEMAAYDSPYVNSNVVGVDDLNTYGHWVYASDYGQVWVPYNEPADWYPYQDGNWCWTPYYGWTWVGYEPWGWAPYHYGRWFYDAGYGWAWWPGPVYQPVAYAPALVAFFGFGGGSGFSFGLSIGFGGGFGDFDDIAWVPLAPYEPYHPWYGSGFNNVTNITNINITNVNVTNVNITKIYKNAGGKHPAIAAVAVRDFENGLGNHHYLPVQARQLQHVALLTRAVPIKPTAASLRFSDTAPKFVRPIQISPRFHTIARTNVAHTNVARATSLARAHVARANSFARATTEARANSFAHTSNVARANSFARATTETRANSFAHTSSVWDRFNANRGTSVGTTAHSTASIPSYARAASFPGTHANVANAHTARANTFARTTNETRPNSFARRSSVWDRFSTSRGGSPSANGRSLTRGASYQSAPRSFGSMPSVPRASSNMSRAASSPWANFSNSYTNRPSYSRHAYSNPSYSRTMSNPQAGFSRFPTYSKAPSYSRVPSYSQPGYSRGFAGGNMGSPRSNASSHRSRKNNSGG